MNFISPQYKQVGGWKAWESSMNYDELLCLEQGTQDFMEKRRDINATTNIRDNVYCPIWIASIEIEPPSNPSTGNVMLSSLLR